MLTHLAGSVEALLHLRWSVSHEVPEFGPAATLISDKRSNKHDKGREIQHTSVLIDEQRCQQEIVYEEEQQIYREQFPHDKDLIPIECGAFVADCTHIQAQQCDSKQHAPHHQIQQVLI